MDLDSIKSAAIEVLTEMGFAAQVSVAEKEETKQVTIDAGGENPLLIGFHGENLNALQAVLAQIFYRQTGTYTPIVVDVGGYRAERAEKIKQIAVGAADRARFLAKAVELPPMNPLERRLAHTFVGELPGVKSESVGEGRDRRVVVRPAGA